MRLKNPRGVGTLVVAMSLTMSTHVSTQRTQLLQIVREPLKPGSEEAYDALEREQAHTSAALGCPHPYLGAETLTGAREAWWFNSYASEADKQRVADAYAANTPLMTALQANSRVKADLTFAPVEVLARPRSDDAVSPRWELGQGRFLVVTASERARRVVGTVFEVSGGTRFIVRAANTRTEADALRRAMGADAIALAVRPEWSFPDPAWIAADPAFWNDTARR
jgi:hypothetical protein